MDGQPEDEDKQLVLEMPEEDMPVVSELRVGDLCPKCFVGHLDYDGLLNLACPNCGFTVGGCFT